MLINKIHISNFKNFENVEVNLGKMNVIVGANASGKSNFIKALKFVKDIKYAGIDNAISMNGGIEYLRNIQSKDNTITFIEIHFESNGGRVIDMFTPDDLIVLEFSKVIYRIELTTKKQKYDIVNEEFKYAIKIKGLKDHKSKFEQEIEKNVSDSNLLGEYNFSLSLKKGKVIFNNPVKENLLVTSSNGIKKEINKNKISPFLFPIDFFIENEILQRREVGNNIIRNRKTLLERYSFLIPTDLLDFFVYDFDLKKAKETTPLTAKIELEENGENLAIVIKNILEDKEKTRQLSNLLTDILPFIKDLEIDKYYNNSLFFKAKEVYYPNAHIPSYLLSDGTISVTAIIIALFFEDNNLSIIEEPEQGIHPALIAKLMQLFYSASERKQVIITTHSPEILKHIKNLQDLILVSRNEKGFATTSKPIEQEMVKAFLENELGIDLLFTQNLLDS